MRDLEDWITLGDKFHYFIKDRRLLKQN